MRRSNNPRAHAAAPRGRAVRPPALPRQGSVLPGNAWMLAALLAALATAWIRLEPSLQFPFYNDDFVYMDALRWRNWLDLLLHPMRVGGYLRPFSRDVHFKVLWGLFGLRPLGYHGVNLALVLACVVGVHAVGRRALGPRAALIAATLFAVSHVHVILVAWASCDQDLWALAFALASTWLFLGRGPRDGALSVACFALALSSKESAALLPLPLFLLAARIGPRAAAARRVLPHALVLLLWAAFYVATRTPESSLSWSAGAAAWLPLRFLLASVGVEGPALLLKGLGRGLTPLLIGATLALAALLFAALRAGGRAARRADSAPQPAWRRALPWLGWCASSLLLLLPVAKEWSAYYFAFPLAGLYLAAGAFLESVPPAALAALPPLLIVLGQATHAEEVDPSAANQDPSVSAVNMVRLRIGWTLVYQAMRDLPAAVPQPADSSRFLFNALPRRNGFVTGDGPALRLLYSNPTLGAAYLGDLTEPAQFAHPLYFFTWSDENVRFDYLGHDMVSFKYEMELAVRLKTAIAETRYEIATRDSSAWNHWNLGHLLRESGDTAGAEAEWRRTGVARNPDPAAVHESVREAQAQHSAAELLALLMNLAYSSPADTAPVLAMARYFEPRHNGLSSVMWYRACRLAPRDTTLLRRGIAEMQRVHTPSGEAQLKRLLAQARAAR